MALEPEHVVETIQMVTQDHLDIRTITLGLNLRSCVHEDINVMAQRVYDRLTMAAEKLVPTAEQLEREYGIPIDPQAHRRHTHRRDLRRDQGRGPDAHRHRARQCLQGSWGQLRGRLYRARPKGRE